MNKKNKVELPEKRALTVDEIISKYPMTVRILMVQLVEQIERLQKNKVSEDWLPTPENINALPEPVKKFIYHIETNTDPAHIVRENILIKDTCKALVLKLEERAPMVDQAFVNIWADKYLSKGDVCYLRKQLKLMLNEAGVKVVKN